MRAKDRIPRATRNTNEAASESGVTLIELVVVIAIISILIAITVPTIRGFLENARRQAHETDRRTIQVAVDAYYTSTNNTRHEGQRQYPIMGKDKVEAARWAWLRLKCDGSAAGKPIVFGPDSEEIGLEEEPQKHPFRGVRGGTPLWQEGSGAAKDGIREDGDPPDPYCPRKSPSSNEPVSPTADAEDDRIEDHWLVDYVSRDPEKDCYDQESNNPPEEASEDARKEDPNRCLVIDSRDYFIDFCELIEYEFIEEFPRSASLDHVRDCDPVMDAVGELVSDAATATPENAAEPPEENPPGSYTWYVDEYGKVQSLYYYFPTSSDPDNRGYFSGVYP